MPVPQFLSNFADKAQAAVNASPLASHLPASLHGRAGSPDPATQPSANQAAAQGGAKNHTLENIQHQFRSLQQQYISNVSPIQKIVTSEKGVVIDYDNASRNSKAQSKELYTWGQSEADDLKDVTDRLAYLNFVQGSLAGSLSTKLDSARGPFKALRDAETALQPRRNLRASLQAQIARIEHESQKAGDKRIVELREQLHKHELEDQQQEKELELMKRKAVRESERIKWEAIREYGEKLVLLSQAATPIIDVLPSLPPTQASPYTGAQTTGAVRASLQRALDNYKTGHINLPPQASGSELSRSDTRSFGESHASELSSLVDFPQPTTTSHSTPSPGAAMPLPEPYPHHTSAASGGASFPHHVSSPPINPQTLNNSPAPVPNVSPAAATAAPFSPSFVPHGSASPTMPVVEPISLPAAMPTVAETGIPITSPAGGPGPASGSLHNIQAASNTAGPRSGGIPGDGNLPGYGQASLPAAGAAAPHHESALEEKRRLAATYSQQQTSASAGPPPPAFSSAAAGPQTQRHESAEEEKKRLEREERERILHAGGSGPNQDNKPDDADLPPYQEPGQN
ncbi:hypothetical protein D9619_003202 [Psilocybe cf. subviscida]|uniref:Sphingolipid long chain base-responsive protein LSP1 n=1 Tax=Psilocybe cf. subviscida TaxID=2480587 RepID=A0A8H5AVH4_9AGAR|nr:hypothetical protein D9619_003202 [Psilocybe cf. subviscida]